MIPSPPEALQHKHRNIRKWLKKNKRLSFAMLALFCVLLIPCIAYGVFRASYSSKVFPNVYVGPVNVSGLDRDQAQAYLESNIENFFKSFPSTVVYEENVWQLPPNIIRFDAASDVQQALGMGRQGSLLDQLKTQLDLIQSPHQLPIQVSVQESLAEELVASIAATLNISSKEPQLVVKKNTTQAGWEIEITPGITGHIFNSDSWRNELIVSAKSLSPFSDTITLELVPPSNSSDQAELAKNRAEKLLEKKLIVTHDESYHSWTLEQQDLVDLIDISGGYSQEAVSAYVTRLAEEIDRQPINARFSFDASKNRVTEFSPALAGLATDIPASSKALTQGLQELERDELIEYTTELVVAESFPEISLNTVNDLGIHELLGRGVSTYVGSIPSRVHNVALAATRISGVLIKPGETFSFNANVGDITKETGYQAAYVIKDGRTELGDGGGVCQDSTTVFRAALDAGLPIVERRGHSYRVGYYEQNAKPGMDATVYSPSTDLKFLNDTPGHLLLQTIVDSPNRILTVELYGTNDGREAEIKNHKLWGVTPPPPDVYVEDASIPPGQTKQVDWKAWGAKASFDYVVTRNDEVIIEKTFTSVYKPWAAVFLKGPSI